MLLSVPIVLACGGMMPAVGRVVASDAQQAILRLGETEHSVEYRVRYAGNADDFAWIIPVPGEILAVAEGSDESFDTLDEATAPLVYAQAAEETGCQPGCGFSKADLDDKSGGTRNGVTVTGSGFAGDYSYTTLAADDPDALLTWLDDNGYDGSLAEAEIAAYVEEGHSWVAVQVRPEVVELDSSVMFSPLRIHYGANADGELRAEFPARMGHSSTAETTQLEIFVLADSLVDLGGGWTSTPNSHELDPGEDAEAAWTSTLESVGSGRAMIWTWSGELADPTDGGFRFVTRFDTITTPANQTVDPVFTETGLFWMQETAYWIPTEGADAAVFLGVGALVARLRRRAAGGGPGLPRAGERGGRSER